MWHLSHQADRRALPLADRHYSRKKVGSPQFTPPGRTLVLLTSRADALWVTSWPFAEYVKHSWPGAWMCSVFRNESETLSSLLINEAVAATRWKYDPPPALGFITLVNEKKVRPKRNPGYCYLKAGWKVCGRTKGGLLALQLLESDMPPAEPPRNAQLTFEDII